MNSNFLGVNQNVEVKFRSRIWIWIWIFFYSDPQHCLLCKEKHFFLWNLNQTINCVDICRPSMGTSRKICTSLAFSPMIGRYDRKVPYSLQSLFRTNVIFSFKIITRTCDPAAQTFPRGVGGEDNQLVSVWEEWEERINNWWLCERSVRWGLPTGECVEGVRGEDNQLVTVCQECEVRITNWWVCERC